jgi:exonuclease III
MKMLIWNIRGIELLAKVKPLKEIMTREQVETVGIQETIKQNFSKTDLG